jgi:hypothetical protein
MRGSSMMVLPWVFRLIMGKLEVVRFCPKSKFGNKKRRNEIFFIFSGQNFKK